MFEGTRYSTALILALFLAVLTSCTSSAPTQQQADPAPATASTTVNITFPAESSGVGDVVSVTVDVLNGSMTLVSGQTLSFDNGVWTGRLADLPLGQALTFVTHGYDGSAVEIFSGTTVQAMTGGSDNTTISMQPVAGPTPVSMPTISQVVLPAEIVSATTVTVSVSLEGSSGDTLSYAITPPSGGGSFSPSSGDVILNGTSATISVAYTAPPTSGTYTHALVVANSQGDAVSVDVVTNIVSAGAPTNVVARGIDIDKVRIYFAMYQDRPDVAGYFLYRGTDLIVTMPTSSVPNYTDSGLATNTEYCYTLKAYDAGHAIVDAGSRSCTTTMRGTQAALATGLSYESRGLAVDANSVYWTEYSLSGSLKKVGLNGGEVTVLASGLSTPLAVAVDGASVYWTEYYPGAVKKVGINGGAVTTLASVQAGSNPGGIAVDASNVYWVEEGSGKINKVGINGGAVTTIATGRNPHAIAVDDSNVYWSENISPGGAVKKVGKNGGLVTPLASGLSLGIAVDPANIYIDENTVGIKMLGLDGRSNSALALDPRPTNTVYNIISCDATSVYWSSSQDILVKVALNGGTVACLAPGVKSPIAIDASSIYWADNTPGAMAIMKMPK